MRSVRMLRWGLLVTFVAMVVIGYLQGEARIVLEKGIRICLECIGIG